MLSKDKNIFIITEREFHIRIVKHIVCKHFKDFIKKEYKDYIELINGFKICFYSEYTYETNKKWGNRPYKIISYSSKYDSITDEELIKYIEETLKALEEMKDEYSRIYDKED